MDWHKAIKEMTDLAEQTSKWKFGQEDTIRWMSNRLKEQTGILIADEVGMGKTRVAMVAIRAVLEAGGSVAVVVPPGLIYQWKKEWEEFLKSIGNKEQDTKSSNEPIMLRSYYSLFEDNSLQFPLAQNAGRWLLISHQFGPPLLRNDARPRRYMLPVLVKALIDVNKGKHKSNSYWQLVKKLYKDNEECIGGAYCPSKNKEGKAPDCPVKIKKDVDCNELPQINKAANYLMEMEKEIPLFDNDDLPFRSLESAKAKEEFKKYFNDEKRGLKMIKKLLGSIDLLIIDEAHKNRDVEDDPKRLGTILRDIIWADNAKRIALTATPMELNAHQWKEAFIRVGEEKNYPESAISEFVNAHKEANKHPDNIKKINDLITASKEFVEKLNPYVTRRMRTKQKEMRALIGDEMCKEQAHPHREWKPIEIEYSEIGGEWKPSVFALEAIGKAAKGCITDDKDLNKLLGRLKIADSRYAAGKISTSGSESTTKKTNGNEIGESNDQEKLDEAINNYFKNNMLDKIDDDNKYNRQNYIQVQGKLRRVQYWNRVLKSNNADLAGHPRIRKTADKIEEILWAANGQLKQEKVLVFGTFLDPMKSLWDVLNRRTVLRLLDRKKSNDEPPIPGAQKCIDNLPGIWAEYQRMKSYLSREYSSKDELKSAIEKGGKSYDDLRDKLTTHIDEIFVATLPGDAAIKNIENAEDDVAKLLRQRLVNDIICNDTEFKQDKKNDTKMKALYIWCEYLESYWDNWDNENEPDHKRQPKLAWARPDYFTGDEEEIKELIELDNFADNVSEEALKGLLKDELGELSGRSGMFARRLFGDVKMETRRVLQSQFNDKNSFPKVLIAQSQVGREGLNLHKACRIVVQFHSEWNPGIIEQQIGRVDRIDSLWEEKAKEWKDKGKQGEMPKITVIPVVFKGTYDSFQYGISKKRRENLKAHLFGELLNEEALAKLPKDVAIREKLEKAAPSFAPEQALPYNSL